ncbi:MAG: hypothetical protein M0026_15375 [Nocardiopsaceae bacterium]|nr:hypothetical protein [Nocardiopsaceae bacterium]
MDEAELQAFLSGPVPDASQCRDIAKSELESGQCDEQTSYGLPSGSTYCGAPKTEGFMLCRYHLFGALHSGASVDELRE